MGNLKIDHATSQHSLHLLQDEIGGTIEGQKLYPLRPAFIQMISNPEPAAALSRKSYIAQVAARQELKVVDALRMIGLDAYCPVELKSVRLNAVKRRIEGRAMMPGYVFPIFDEFRDRWQTIQSERQGQGIKGVIRLFKFGMRPVAVPDAAIQAIHDREQDLKAGNYRSKLPSIPFKQGDWVQIIEHSSFAGLIGKVVGTSPKKWRVSIELDILGQETLVTLNADQIRLAGYAERA